MPIPIIDLFAGPGGLGEGFSSLRDANGNQVFEILLSIEKDPIAWETLRMRAAYRKFSFEQNLKVYFKNVREPNLVKLPYAAEFEKLISESGSEAKCAELGKIEKTKVNEWIKTAIKGRSEWILIGGPPCQAYSLAGRSRMRGADPEAFETDHRHFLYKEYLRVIREFEPTAFIMENVKGLLSAHNDGQSMFTNITNDLASPKKGLRYKLIPLVSPASADSARPSDYVIRAEEFGVPQSRHRVIFFGVREDVELSTNWKLRPSTARENVSDAIGDLPALRSGVSGAKCGRKDWHDLMLEHRAVLSRDPEVVELGLMEIIGRAVDRSLGIQERGEPFRREPSRPPSSMTDGLWKFLRSKGLGGVLHHESRTHMPADLNRYLFCAAYSERFGLSPNLKNFPLSLLPGHKNINRSDLPFADRFRVQVCARPSSTVVSHIAKDGHYYIHFDPAQCRSLTVREAARLQTFPDDYFFCGNRTQQFTQVGNAVPPYLAFQIARCVARALAENVSEQTHGSFPPMQALLYQ